MRVIIDRREVNLRLAGTDYKHARHLKAITDDGRTLCISPSASFYDQLRK